MTAKPLRIDIVSDVMCPWCAVGYSSLNKALEQFQDKIAADIHWQPFELNPNMAPEGQNLREHLTEKYDSTEEQSREIRQRITDMGKELGFKFNFTDEMKIYNTFQAHQLLSWQQDSDKQTELKLALLTAYFKDGKDVSQPEVLLEVVESIGLDKDEAKQILDQENLAPQVREEQSKWQSMGISSVPSFIIDNKYLVSGGQPVEAFVQMLEKISQES